VGENDSDDFWSRGRCRREIARLESIPSHEARTLFQTVLTDNDQTKLKLIMRDRVEALVAALDADDYRVAGSHWQLLARLRIIGNDELETMLEEHAVLPLLNFVLRRVGDFKEKAGYYQFEEAECQLERLRDLTKNIPHEELENMIDDLEAVLRNAIEKKSRRTKVYERT
jgi:hypothetical protein